MSSGAHGRRELRRLNANFYIDVTAFTVPAAPFVSFDTFYRIRGSAEISGIAGNWYTGASTDVLSRKTLGHRLLRPRCRECREPALRAGHDGAEHPLFREYSIDLSSVAVGQAFTVQSHGGTRAYNRAASSVNNRVRSSRLRRAPICAIRARRRAWPCLPSASSRSRPPPRAPPEVPEEPEPCVPARARPGRRHHPVRRGQLPSIGVRHRAHGHRHAHRRQPRRRDGHLHDQRRYRDCGY